MRLRIPFLISLGLNVIFAAAFLFGLVRFSSPKNAVFVRDIDASPALLTNHLQTNVIVRSAPPPNFTWEQVESDDYVTYIENLRKIGCPPATIRDIIVADVNGLYAHRRRKWHLCDQQ